MSSSVFASPARLFFEHLQQSSKSQRKIYWQEESNRGVVGCLLLWQQEKNKASYTKWKKKKKKCLLIELLSVQIQVSLSGMIGTGIGCTFYHMGSLCKKS